MLKKKLVKGMLSLATAIMLVGSDPVIPMMESVGVVQEVEAASLKLSNKSVSVMTGEKSKLTLKGVSSKKKKSVKWRSNSKNLVVSYSKKDTRSATFYARKAGTYKVTATYGKKTYVAVVKASKKGMNVTSRTLNKGQKYTLKLKGVKGKAKWSSSKKSVVTVKTIKNGKGAVITAKKPGSATITATVGEKKLVCVVKVKGTTAVVTPKPTTAPKPTENPKPQPTTSPKPTEVVKPEEKPTPEPTPAEVKADKITLNRESVTFTALNQTFSLSATVTPENAEEKAVGWNSINTSAVTVDENGKITAVGRGSSVVFCFLKSNGEVFANGDNYGYSFYARKQGKCVVSIYVDGKLKDFWDVEVTSDDQNWATYESWLNGVLKNIEAANSNWKDLNPIQKITLLGQYILDNYDYDYDPMSAFHLNGKGNCNASANVLADMATRLGLRADVVTPKAYVVHNPSHVVARVWYNNVVYLIEAGYEGKAGNRGTVTCIKASEQ